MVRAIASNELAVLERALQVGATRSISAEILASLPKLRVTAGCKCGCATVWFGPKGDASTGYMLADALATSNEHDVSVIVWGEGQTVIGLELVGPGPTPLPAPESVRSYSNA